MSEAMAKKITPTPKQEAAINATHAQYGNILVSASAGSGKTRVLVERVLHQLLEENVSLDEMVIVTFTEAAAREMKERIQAALEQEIRGSSNEETKERLREQLSLLPVASIQTIDAFCRRIVNRYHYLIGRDADYRIITSDDVELEELLNDVWDQWEEAVLAKKDTSLATDYEAVAVNLSDGRSQKRESMRDLIKQLYTKSRSHADPADWLRKLLHYYNSGSYTDSVLFKCYVRPYVYAQLNEYYQAFKELYDRSMKGEVAFVAKIATSRKDLDYIREVLTRLQDKELTYSDGFAAFKKIKNCGKPSIRNTSGTLRQDLEAFGDEVDTLNKRYENQKPKNLGKKFFGFDETTVNQIFADAYDLAQSIVNLTISYSEAMAVEMEVRKVTDHAGIELAALEILQYQDDESGALSEAKAYYQSHIKEIMIDEYQDVNELQDTILAEISHEDMDGEPNNRFMVGDLKQSIYRFRFSDPSIFRTKQKAYSSSDDGTEIVLQENFRSRKEVLDFANVLFNHLMDADLGGTDYQDNAQLVYGRDDYPEASGFEPEILLVDSSENTDALSEQDSQEMDNYERQAIVAAARIRQLLADGTVYDAKEQAMRPIRPKDIAILGVNRKHYTKVEEVFRDCGIPLQEDSDQHYFAHTEILMMVNFLKVIDNTRQDIPLVGVLRSEIGQFSDDDLATIRIAHPEAKTYSEACTAYAVSGEDAGIQAKLRRIYHWISAWRDFARTATLSDLLWRIYRDTSYLEIASAQPHGDERLVNLYELIHIAETFERTGRRGLFTFVRYIESIEDREKDLETPVTLDPDSNAVRMLTIHGSKGLQFPIVICFNVSNGFNNDDEKGKIVVNDRFGLGVEHFDSHALQTYENPLHTYVQVAEKQDARAEEMRKFYVAVTRAEQKVILIASDKHWAQEQETFDSELQKRVPKNKPLPLLERLKSGSFWGWVKLVLRANYTQEFFHSGEETGPRPLTLTSGGASSRVNFHYCTPEQLVTLRAQIQSGGVKDTAEASAVEQTIVPSPAHFVYPHQAATETASNYSVSEWKRRLYHAEDQQISAWHEQMRSRARGAASPEEIKAPIATQPCFMRRATPAERGSAIHLLMQKIDLATRPTAADFERLHDVLVETHELSANILHADDFQHLAAFFDPAAKHADGPDMASLLVNNAMRLYRERSFTYQIPSRLVPDEITASQEDDPLIVHGIIDGFFFDETGALWLFDYKTDQLGDLTREEQRERLKERYFSQLVLYSDALAVALKRPVDHRVIIALDTKESFDYGANRDDCE